MQLLARRGLQDFVIAAIYYDYSSDQGTVTISRRTYERFWNNRGYTSIGVYAQPGIDDENPAHHAPEPHPLGTKGDR